MTIKEYLQKTQYSRLSNYNGRWMFCGYGGWHVVERRPYARKTTTLLVTENEEEAVALLAKDDEEYMDKLIAESE